MDPGGYQWWIQEDEVDPVESTSILVDPGCGSCWIQVLELGDPRGGSWYIPFVDPGGSKWWILVDSSCGSSWILVDPCGGSWYIPVVDPGGSNMWILVDPSGFH